MRCATSSTMGWTRRVRPSAFPRPTVCGRAGSRDQRTRWYHALSGRLGAVTTRRPRRRGGGRRFERTNPRVARSDACYTIALTNRHSMTATQPMTVVGRHCESGDEIARDVPLPADLHAGDLLAVAATGAYHHSMASTYNMVGRPPLVAGEGRTRRELVRRETSADLLYPRPRLLPNRHRCDPSAPGAAVKRFFHGE